MIIFSTHDLLSYLNALFFLTLMRIILIILVAYLLIYFVSIFIVEQEDQL